MYHVVSLDDNLEISHILIKHKKLAILSENEKTEENSPHFNKL